MSNDDRVAFGPRHADQDLAKRKRIVLGEAGQDEAAFLVFQRLDVHARGPSPADVRRRSRGPGAGEGGAMPEEWASACEGGGRAPYFR